MESGDGGQPSDDTKQRLQNEAGSEKSWIEQECRGCDFGDVRLEKRFAKLIEQISGGVGNSIPLACADWANTKAAYRFFSNDRVSEEEILRGHFQSTRDRFRSTEGPVLILHDTSEFVYKRGSGESGKAGGVDGGV
jgi:hypothetical protein